MSTIASIQLADISLLNYSHPDQLDSDLKLIAEEGCKFLIQSRNIERISLFMPVIYKHRNHMCDLDDCSEYFKNEFLKYEKLTVLGELG